MRIGQPVSPFGSNAISSYARKHTHTPLSWHTNTQHHATDTHSQTTVITNITHRPLEHSNTPRHTEHRHRHTHDTPYTHTVVLLEHHSFPQPNTSGVMSISRWIVNKRVSRPGKEANTPIPGAVAHQPHSPPHCVFRVFSVTNAKRL